jgi:hypothetical protein
VALPLPLILGLKSIGKSSDKERFIPGFADLLVPSHLSWESSRRLEPSRASGIVCLIGWSSFSSKLTLKESTLVFWNLGGGVKGKNLKAYNRRPLFEGLGWGVEVEALGPTVPVEVAMGLTPKTWLCPVSFDQHNGYWIRRLYLNYCHTLIQIPISQESIEEKFSANANHGMSID